MVLFPFQLINIDSERGKILNFEILKKKKWGKKRFEKKVKLRGSRTKVPELKYFYSKFQV